MINIYQIMQVIFLIIAAAIVIYAVKKMNTTSQNIN